MANADQVKLLIKSHYENNPEKFSTVALQVAAHEARLGHGGLAETIRKLVDKSKTKRVKVVSLNRDLHDLMLESAPTQHLAELIVPGSMKKRIERVLLEFRQRHKLKKHGMINRHKLLLAGPPGTGKTMTAAVLAYECSIPLYTILMDKLVTRFMGETSAKLRQVFNMIANQQGVYLFDEFDAIGAQRARDNDVGEMRRVLNAFLQFIEDDQSDSLIIAATNSPMILDQALFRRFDDVLYYHKPNQDEIKRLVENRLSRFKPKTLAWKSVIKDAGSLSHAEIAKACNDAIKESILADKTQVTMTRLCAMLKDRQEAYGQEWGSF